MNNYGIGTPLSVQWHLNKPDGTPFSLAGYTYTLKYKANRGSGIARSTNVTTDDEGKLSNVIVWNFAGHEQVATGVYDLELTIYRSGKKLCQSTYLGAFSLEKHVQKFPEMIHTLQREANMHEQQAAVVELFSAAEWWMYKPVEPVAGSDGFWYVNGSIVLDDNDNPVPTKYSVRFDHEDQCLYVYVGVYGEESYQEIQKITDVADIIAYAKDTFDANEAERQETFEENEEKRQENEEKRQERFEELEAFVRAATECVATADTYVNGWYRSNTVTRVTSNTIIIVKANGSSGYAIINSNGTVLASSDGNDDLVYTATSVASLYVASRSNGEVIEYKIMVVSDKKLQDEADNIDDLVRLAYKASASASPAAVDGETEVTLSASLAGFNGESVEADKTDFIIDGVVQPSNKVKLSSPVTVNAVLTKGGVEYKASVSISGTYYIYYGIGSSASAVRAMNKSAKKTTKSPAGTYTVPKTTAGGQYLYFLIPTSMNAPSSFQTSAGFEADIKKVSETLPGFNVYRSSDTVTPNMDIVIKIV